MLAMGGDGIFFQARAEEVGCQGVSGLTLPWYRRVYD